jgi:glycosyltransferase involved in cell wall biosynthesis
MPVALGSPISVVIPAHNEEAVIGRCLRALLAGAAPGELEVVVVCNGCQDRTANVARQEAPEATVLELPQASKVAALNAGDEHAHFFPRFYVDADVELPLGSLRRTEEVLSRAGVLCAAPRPVFDLDSRPWAVRAFYNVWQKIPYITEGLVGSGVYALSEEGRRRFSAFPQLTNDDQFVSQLFAPSERISVPDANFVVHPPLRLAGLLAMRTRAYRGNIELARSGLAQYAPPRSGAGIALRQALRPQSAPAVGAYLAVNLVARLQARARPQGKWERDDSARSHAGRTSRSAAIGTVDGDAAPLICYVTSQYPALSHTFVMREVLGVRAAGLSVETVSVHRANPSHLLAEVDRVEAANTWDIFPLDLRSFLRAHWRAVSRSPGAYVSALWASLAAAPAGLRARLWQLFYFGEAIALWDHARQTGARHLHAHFANVGADLCWRATDYANRARPKERWSWSFSLHGPTELYAADRYNLSRKVANAYGVICISEFARSQLMYLSDPSYWAKLRVVHMGVDLDRYPFTPAAQRDFLSVLCVARLVPAKGLELLVDAIGSLRGRGRDVEAVIVGEGPLEEALKVRAERLGTGDSVRFAGAVGQDTMAAHYAEADVFCLPSFAEGVPVVLMEAMATGRPVVATRIAGIAELVEDGVSGVLVAPGNLDELTSALERLACSAELRVQMGLAGRRKVEADFDARRCGSQVADVLRELARPAARP